MLAQGIPGYPGPGPRDILAQGIPAQAWPGPGLAQGIQVQLEFGGLKKYIFF